MRFFVGLHQPSDARHFDRAFISVNRLRTRRSAFAVGEWILDSGAFTEISTWGGYRSSVDDYAREIRRWGTNGRLLAAVSQDWMCEPFILQRTGLSLGEHQRLTIERFDELCALDVGVPILPVLQGFAPAEYVAHLRAYDARLGLGAWVGVGSICKRNTDVAQIESVLLAIRRARPDLRLHGFGLKQTALSSGVVRAALSTADSMAWSFNARRNGRNANDWREAKAFADRIEHQSYQLPLFIEAAA
jgi:hypothetical protein